MSASVSAAGHRSLGWSLALLAFAQLIFALDLNIVFVALPEIGAGLGFSEQSLQWVVSAYTVFCGGFLLFGGRAADLLGQRRMFVTRPRPLRRLLAGRRAGLEPGRDHRRPRRAGHRRGDPVPGHAVAGQPPVRGRAAAQPGAGGLGRRRGQRADFGLAARRRADRRLRLVGGVLRQCPAGRHRRPGRPGGDPARPAAPSPAAASTCPAR